MLSAVYWLLLRRKVKCSLKLDADTPRASYMCMTSAAAVRAQRKRAMIRKCQAGALGRSVFSPIHTFSSNTITLEDVYRVKMLVAIWRKWLL